MCDLDACLSMAIYGSSDNSEVDFKMTKLSVYSYVRRNKKKNFGDDLSLPVCEYASGKSFVHGDRTMSDVYAVGSLLQVFHKRTRKIKSKFFRKLNGKQPLVIWGTGVIDDIQLDLPSLKVLAVRGPHTAYALGLKTEVAFGDPGLLISDILPAPAKLQKIGIVPHYVDKEHPVVAAAAKDERFVIIDVEDDWQNTVRHISQCDLILSSSLHGLIVADSYGIPNQWLGFSNNVVGGAFKFHDYADGIGRTNMTRVEVHKIEDIDIAVSMAESFGASLSQVQISSLKNDLKQVLRAHYKNY